MPPQAKFNGNSAKHGLVQVVHNDIKSKNILLSQGGEVAKIADVGTAAVLGATATASSTGFVGTFVYAAPEQLLGNRASHTTKVCTASCRYRSDCQYIRLIK